MEELAAVRVPGKSLLQEYAHWLAPETMRLLNEQLILAARQPACTSEQELANAIELETVWLDRICVKTNIHFLRSA